VVINGIDVHTSPSIGIAFYPSDGASVGALISHADAAMYTAKQRGRNQVQHFAASMGEGAGRRLRLEGDLHRALELQQFDLHYQPKVDVLTGTVRSAEALIRWHHPELGVISPTEFIPVAEESGLIGPIGDWVMRQACRQARLWQEQGLPFIRVGVNVSAAQFRLGALIESVRAALEAESLEPRFLEVELTETAVMSNP
jgi:diguanylate cyclase